MTNARLARQGDLALISVKAPGPMADSATEDGYGRGWGELDV